MSPKPSDSQKANHDRQKLTRNYSWRIILTVPGQGLQYMPRGGEGRMLMTRRLPRLLRTGSLPRHLSIAAPVIAVILVVAVATAPVRSLPAVAAGPSDPVAAGPAAWTDDLSPIAPSDWS